MNVLDYLAFLADYQLVLLAGIAVAAVAMFVYIVMLRYKITQDSGRVLKQLNALNVLLNENDTDTRQLLSRISRNTGGSHALSDLQKNINDDFHKIQMMLANDEDKKRLAAIQEHLNAQSDVSRNIHALFEQHGVFLHDRFHELGAERAKQAAEMQQLMRDEFSRLHDIEALKYNIAKQFADWMNKMESDTAAQVSDAIKGLAGEMDAKLEQISDKLADRFNDSMGDSMRAFEAMRQQLEELLAAREEIENLGQSVSSLSRLMLSKDIRRAERADLPALLAMTMPQEFYALRPVFGEHCAAAKITLPGESGAIVIDDKLPLEEYETLHAPQADEQARAQARARAAQLLKRQIELMGERFIAPPRTADSALLFVPSESAFAEIQANFQECIAYGYERRVWLTSPMTLTAMLKMARNVGENYQARTQLDKMRASLTKTLQESRAFELRLREIGDHVTNAMRSVQQAERAGNRMAGDVQNIVGAEGNGRAQRTAAAGGAAAQEAEGNAAAYLPDAAGEKAGG